MTTDAPPLTTFSLKLLQQIFRALHDVFPNLAISFSGLNQVSTFGLEMGDEITHDDPQMFELVYSSSLSLPIKANKARIPKITAVLG